VARDVEYPGDAGTMFGYLAEPKNAQRPQPGVIVVHENRGLVDHIKDVARRVARAGFVALAPDLLSRQGGTKLFTDATTQAQAYGRTLPQERLADLYSTMTFLKLQPTVMWQRLGAVGFCAGGGNCWSLAVGAPDLNAVVIYYGTPVPAVDQLDSLRASVLAHYAETDRTLSNNVLPIASSLLSRQKTFGQKRGVLVDDSDLDRRIDDLEAQRVASGSLVVGNEMEVVSRLVDAFDECRGSEADQRSVDVTLREQRLLRDRARQRRKGRKL